VKRSVIEGPDWFDSEMTVSEDTDLLFRLCLITKFCFVNRPLVNINRSAEYAADRLSRLFNEGDDRTFYSKAHMYNKWLALLKNRSDSEISQMIRNSLRELYYNLLTIKIKRLGWSEAVAVAKHINNLGDSAPKVFAALISNVVKSAFGRTFGAQ
jgi:hypothetical protein